MAQDTMLSPQANIPSRRNAYQVLVGIGGSIPEAQLSAPRIILVAQAGVEVLPRVQNAVIRVIQNCGTVAVKFLVSDEMNCSSDQFHQILSPGMAQDDGSGAQADFSKISHRVSCYCDSGNGRIAIFYALAPENL